MNKTIAFLLAMLGINVTSACGQQAFENADVKAFAEYANNPDVQLVDVRTSEEFAEGHLEGALNMDVKSSSFIQTAKEKLNAGKRVAVYCRSGRRSVDAANQLTSAGFSVVNLKGGIVAWKEAGMPVTNDAYEVDIFKTKSGKTVKFHAIVHASIRIDYDGKEIMVDPVGKLGNRTIDYTSMPKADYLLVTHEHGDHFDKAAIAQLSNNDTHIIMNKRCADMLGQGETMVNGDQRQLAEDISIQAVPAYNITEGRTQFHPKGRDNGYILTIDGLRIYIAGDTEDIPEMADIKDIDIAFLPCNQPYTMTVDQLLRAARTIKPRVMFPYHYGQTDVSKTPELLKADNIEVRVRHYE